MAELKRASSSARDWGDRMVSDADRARDQLEMGGWSASFAPESTIVAALRQNARRCGAESLALLDAAFDFDRCGRDRLQLECFEQHVEHRPFSCGRAVLCPSCARAHTARQVEIYEARATQLLANAPGSMRPKMLTLPYRPREHDSLADAFHATRDASKRLLRVVYGIPRDAEDWAAYKAVYPITNAERQRVDPVTPGGRLRSPATIDRLAWTIRRRSILARRRKEIFGAVVAIEFGAKRGNAHAHVFLLAKYVPQKILSAAWRAVTGNSYVVDVRAVKGGVGAGMREVVKYLTKFSARTPEQLVEMYVATLSVSEGSDGDMHARTHRRIELVGVMRSRSDEEDDWIQPPVVCKRCGNDMRVVGWIPDDLWRMGIDRAPEAYRYNARAGPGA